MRVEPALPGRPPVSVPNRGGPHLAIRDAALIVRFGFRRFVAFVHHGRMTTSASHAIGAHVDNSMPPERSTRPSKAN